MRGEHLGLPVLGAEQDLVGLAVAAGFHAGRSGDHSGHSDPGRLGLLREQPLDVCGGHMAFDHIAIRLRRVARTQLVGDAQPLGDGSDVLDIVDLDLKAGLADMVDPMLAAAARRRLGDDERCCSRALSAGSERQVFVSGSNAETVVTAAFSMVPPASTISPLNSVMAALVRGAGMLPTLIQVSLATS